MNIVEFASCTFCANSQRSDLVPSGSREAVAASGVAEVAQTTVQSVCLRMVTVAVVKNREKKN